MKKNDEISVERDFEALGRGLDEAEMRHRQVEFLREICGDDDAEFEESLAHLLSRWQAEAERDGGGSNQKIATADLADIVGQVSDQDVDNAVSTLLGVMKQPADQAGLSSVEEIAPIHGKIYYKDAVGDSPAAVEMTFPIDPSKWQPMGITRSSHADDGKPKTGWVVRSALILNRAAGGHMVNLDWVGPGLEADGVVLVEGVVLDVDGCLIGDVTFEVYEEDRKFELMLTFMLPEKEGQSVPLAEAQTCLEDDGTVRVQLWTKKRT